MPVSQGERSHPDLQGRENFHLPSPSLEPSSLILQPLPEWNFPSRTSSGSKLGWTTFLERGGEQIRTQPETAGHWTLCGPHLLLEETPPLPQEGSLQSPWCLAVASLGHALPRDGEPLMTSPWPSQSAAVTGCHLYLRGSISGQSRGNWWEVSGTSEVS